MSEKPFNEKLRQFYFELYGDVKDERGKPNDILA